MGPGSQFGGSDGRVHRRHPLLAPARGRAHPVRRLPAPCKLREGQRGLCFVRAREDDEIVLTSYGRSSGFCVDPVEKKPLNHFLPGTSVLSFGTAGCNLACRFCQNWDISKSKEIDTLADAPRPRRSLELLLDSAVRSVAFTYNDPVIFLEYAIDVADACHDLGIKTVAVTAGYICREPRAELFAHMDAANIDLKGFTDDFYRHICGGRAPRGARHPRVPARQTGVWFELTTLLIPGLNDSDAELDADDPLDRRAPRARRARSTSPRSIPTTGCLTGRPHLRRPSPGRGTLHPPTACTTPTPETSTTPTGRARPAPAAARMSSDATGTNSAPTASTSTANARPAGPLCRASSTARSAARVRSANPSCWAGSGPSPAQLLSPNSWFLAAVTQRGRRSSTACAAPAAAPPRRRQLPRAPGSADARAPLL